MDDKIGREKQKERSKKSSRDNPSQKSMASLKKTAKQKKHHQKNNQLYLFGEKTRTQLTIYHLLYGREEKKPAIKENPERSEDKKSSLPSSIADPLDGASYK